MALFTSLISSVSGDKERSENKNGSKFCFVTGACCIPHPEKRQTGGEDAYFVTPKAVGVFDGVGGWASLGINAGLYSARLADLTREQVLVSSCSETWTNVWVRFNNWALAMS